MKLNITISSGKGGTGKTFISTNIAKVLEKKGEQVRYLDCDVEEPNGHLFLKPEIQKRTSGNSLYYWNGLCRGSNRTYCFGST